MPRRTDKVLVRGFVYFLLTALPVLAQDYIVNSISRHILTNEGVVSLAKAGFDELFIIERIKTSRTRFDTTIPGLVAMKQAGVSEDLIRAMALEDQKYRKALEADIATAGQPALLARPPGPNQPIMVMVERHWWGFRWVRVFQ